MITPEQLQAEKLWMASILALRIDRAQEVRQKWNIDLRRVQQIYFKDIQKIWYQALIGRKLQVATLIRKESGLTSSILKVGIEGNLQQYLTRLNLMIESEKDIVRKKAILNFKQTLEKELL